MQLVIAGFVIGAFCGSIYFGYHGWLLSALLGGLAGLVISQKRKLEQLEQRVRQLAEEQARLIKAAKPQPTSPQQPVAAVRQPHQEVTIQPVIATTPVPVPQAMPAQQEEVLDLDLPEIPLTETLAQPIINKPLQSPPQSKVPGLGDKFIDGVIGFFTRGNPIVRVGMVVMFFGMSFLVKYVSSQGLLPIELRLTGVVLAATALLIFGWKTRQRAGGYGLVLQAGGIAVIYLTLFAAAALYNLVPMSLAFGLLFVVVLLGTILALLQNAQVLAILATAGGFLAPILTSTGQGSHVGLFSFYLILNLGVLTISLHKTWRLLNWVGFVFTFVITTAWGVLKYQPEQYLSTQPFLLAFFMLYLCVSILFSLKQPANLKGLVDGSLIFGLPLVAFGLQTALLKHTQYGLALSALGLAVTYVVLSWVLMQRHRATQTLLIQAFLALGIGFATLAIPLAVDAGWTSVSWALEAVGLLWVGLRRQVLRSRLAAYLLHAAAACSLVVVHGVHTGARALIDGDFLALLLLAASDLAMAYMLFRQRDQLFPFEKLMATLALGFGLVWWFIAGIMELNAHILATYQLGLCWLLVGSSGLVMQWLGDRFSWTQLQQSCFGLLPLAVILSAHAYQNDLLHPSQSLGVVGLGLFLFLHYRVLFHYEGRAELGLSPGLLSAWHILGSWWLFGLIFWETAWQQDHRQIFGTAGTLLWFAAFAVPLAVLIGATRRPRWPMVGFELDYKNWIPAPLIFCCSLWFISASGKTIEATAAYLPLLNGLDLGQLAIILVFAYAFKRGFLSALNVPARWVISLLGAMLFVWINLLSLRALSRYQLIAYNPDSLWASVQVQMTLSILWTLCALLVMNLSRRIQHRQFWMVGAGLLSLVVIKLFTQDLTGSGTLARIVSFLVVGVLMLLIGFLSPIPAQAKVAQEEPASEGGGAP